MPLIQEKPFTPMRLEEERAQDKSEVLTIRLNLKEREQLNEAKRFIQQDKDSTAIKQLMFIGLQKVLHDQETHYILDVVLNNRRKNERTGVPIDTPTY